MNKYAILALICLNILVGGCKNLEEAGKVLVTGINPTPPPETGPRDKEQIKKSVVKITSKEGRQGTGFVVGLVDNTAYVLTAKHVVEGDATPSIEFLGGTREFKVGKVENDENADISLLTMTGSIPQEAIPLYMVNDFDLKTGDKVFTFGFPLGGVSWSYDELS